MLLHYRLRQIIIPQPFNHCFAFQRNVLLQANISRRCANLHAELTWRDVPLALTIVAVVAELLGVEFHSYSFCFTRFERYAGESLQLNWPNVLIVSRWRKVNLRYLVGGH